jgi:hypothetical protein
MRVDQRIETINIKGMEWEVRIGVISHQWRAFVKIVMIFWAPQQGNFLTRRLTVGFLIN